MPEITPLEKANNMLKTASATMHQLSEHIASLQSENENLRQQLETVKAAATEKVTLEKVAAASQSAAEELASTLISHALLPETKKQACITACMEDPNNIIKIAVQAIKSSEAPEESGYGIKSAATSDDIDGKQASDLLYAKLFDEEEGTY